MLIPRFVISMFSVGTMVLCAGVSTAQHYPNKPIRLVTSSYGSGQDLAARLVAQGLSTNLGQQVVVDNRGSGVRPGETVSGAQADGYTVLFYGNSLWIGQLLRAHTPYDATKDFLPITTTNRSPNIVVVPLSLPVRSVAELIALAKAKPGALNYASGSAGASNHLAAELFKSMAGVNIMRIPYKTGGTEITDLISGRVQVMFSTAGAVMSHVKAGKLRPLAITSAQPSALYPGLPTVADAGGVPGYESVSLSGLFAPAKTPSAIIERLNREVVKVLNMPFVKEKLNGSGVEAISSSPKDFAATIKADMLKWGKLIKDAGITAN